MPSLPDVFAFQRSKLNGVVTIVASIYTLKQADVDPAADLIIFADTLTVDAHVLLRERTIRIVARRLIADASDAQLDVSGGPPDPPKPAAAPPAEIPPAGRSATPGGPGEKGARGRDAGRVYLLAGSVQGKLSLYARGGVGQIGQPGQPGGQGAPGANGADAVIGVGARRVDSPPQPGGPGGSGGRGGSGGQGGDGGKGGSIHIWSPDASRIAADPSAAVAGGGQAALAPGGAGGRGGIGGVGGRKTGSEFVRGRDPHNRYFLIDARAPSGDKGADGAKGGDGGGGGLGAPGEVAPTVAGVALRTFAGDTPAAFAYAHLLLQQAKLQYLAADYAATEATLAWVVQLADADGAPNTEWNAIADQARALLAQLAQRVDFFGHSADWVPLVSFKYYQTALTGMLTLGMAIENNYNTYSTWLKAQTTAFAGANALLDQGRQALSTFEQSQTKIDAQIVELDASIVALTSEQVLKEQKVLLAGQAFQLAVERRERDCTFADMIKAVQTLVAIGTSAYNAADALKTIKGLELKKLPLEKFVKQVKVVVTSFKDIRSNYMDIAGSITPATPDAAKLVVEQEKFDKMIASYLDMPEAANYKAIVHDFVGTVTARNGQVMERSNTLLARERLAATIVRKRSEIDRLAGDAAATQDPSLPQFRTYVAGLYNDFKEHYLEHVYYEHQAYRYWALANDEPFAISDRSLDGMAAYHADLQTRTLKAINSVLSPTQPFEELTISIVPPLDPSAPNPFDDLRSRGRLTFQVPLDVRAFQGLAQVIATRFTIALDGARVAPPDDLVYVRLWHQGQGTFFDAHGARFDFAHECVMSMYEYALAPDGTMTFKAGGNLGGEGDDARIGLSPYAAWTIELPAAFNKGVDLSGVSRITIAFSGRAVPVAPRLAAASGGGTSVAIVDRPAGYAVL